MKLASLSKTKIMMTALLLVLSFLCSFLCFNKPVYAAEEDENKEVVVVIDPGHGGKNEGAIWNGWVEKEITMVTAKAMKEHLEKFEGVKVYLTHEDVEDNLDLDERARIAKGYNADYFLCLHYNMSGKHTHYGSELWIPRRGDNNRKGYQMGTLIMEQFKAIGLSDRGIKTRKNRRKQDYYGILRASQELDVPCILVEHAHLDHEKDAFFTNELSDFARFGRLDAEAVARYFGLKSEELGEDYSQENYRVEVSSKKTYGIPSETINGDYVIPSKIDPVEDDQKAMVATVNYDAILETQGVIRAKMEKQNYLIQQESSALAKLAYESLPIKASSDYGDEVGEDPAESTEETINSFRDLPKDQFVALLIVFGLVFTGISVGIIKVIY